MERLNAARLKLGMVGGGRDAMIGATHRMAARLDDQWELVAGCFSSTAEKSRASGADLGLADTRVYADFNDMAKREARLKAGIDAVAIVTPNHMHAPVAKAFLRRGIHVICDKPLTATLAEAKGVRRAAENAGCLFALTHNYTGYAMVRQAREMIAAGELGAIRVVQVEYPQEWLATPLETRGHKQASWRTDPAKTGAGGAIGDIGTHAWNLLRFMTGLQLSELSAELSTFVDGRAVDDDAQVRLRFDGGARGMLWASQVSPGFENALKIRIAGQKASLEWAQETPDKLWYAPLGAPRQLLTKGGAGATDAAKAVSRFPGGHPEGYITAFATLYSEFSDAIRTGKDLGDVPGIDDGVEGVAFVDACVRSSKRNAAWVGLNI